MLFNWVQPLFNRYAQRCAKGVTRDVVSFTTVYLELNPMYLDGCETPYSLV